jgi:enterochelin esterase-like enzyme
VIYALHGLPTNDTAYSRFDVAGFGQAAQQAGRPAIVVAPQGARPGDSDPEWHDWGPGRDWESVVAIGVVRRMDRWYRTIRDRRDRALIGISAGAYGAALIGVHHLDTFSVIQSWSGYFRPTDPTGTHVIDRGSPRANAASSVFAAVPRLGHAFAARPTHLSFYVGDQDTKFRADNVNLDAQLTAAKVPHEFRLYPGGHTWFLWDVHAEEWLGAALAELEAPH